MLLLSNVCTFFILFSTELTLSLFIIKLKFTWKMFFIWIFIWNLVVTAWKNLPLSNLLVLWRIYFKWQSRTFLEPSLLGLCCYWFMRMVSVEFCCVQSLQEFSLLFYRHSLPAALLSLVLGLHSCGVFWLPGTILWYCGVIFFLSACSLCNNICLEL